MVAARKRVLGIVLFLLLVSASADTAFADPPRSVPFPAQPALASQAMATIEQRREAIVDSSRAPKCSLCSPHTGRRVEQPLCKASIG